ncbi:hypothetical protein EJ377_03140 [Chryseobacterium arthrosphaerae]|uniref:Uncharacterized protein n=1 Tax=Chryseobacterium arthrosphaerae TaxID=651561 RepID=A0A3S0Q794_9FLAO|nr:hypothetical protein EJ377_03140 [Chryseobacterium arthrosphaerae]
MVTNKNEIHFLILSVPISGKITSFQIIDYYPAVWFMDLQQEFVYVGDDAVVEHPENQDVSGQIWESVSSRWKLLSECRYQLFHARFTGEEKVRIMYRWHR